MLLWRLLVLHQHVVLPVECVHHVGRKSGTPSIAPMVYLADHADPGVICVFASKGAAPDNPAWYHNLVAAGSARIEIGTDVRDVVVAEMAGDRRDRVYAEQARRLSVVADDKTQATGVRKIPVLALSRTDS